MANHGFARLKCKTLAINQSIWKETFLLKKIYFIEIHMQYSYIVYDVYYLFMTEKKIEFVSVVLVSYFNFKYYFE